MRLKFMDKEIKHGGVIHCIAVSQELKLKPFGVLAASNNVVSVRRSRHLHLGRQTAST